MLKTNKGISTVVIVMLGTFISSFDINVVNMVLPIIQTEFHTTMGTIEWVIIAYLMVLSATQLTFGRLSDMWGHKRIYITGFVFFVISSFLCALSTSIEMLIIFRVTQALGASMISSSASPLIVEAVEPKNRGKSLGMLAVAVAVAACAGPALGGLLASKAGWSSIFFINVPIGIVICLLAVKIIKSDSKERIDVHFDFPGSVLIIAAIFLILLPLDLISKSYFSIINLISFILGILALILFIIVEKKSKHPILNLELFSNRVFAGSNFAAMFFYMAEFIMVFLAPYYLQNMHEFTPFEAGLMMLPMSVAMIFGAPLSGTIADRMDSRYISCIGLAVMTIAILLVTRFDASSPVWFLVISFFMFGFGGGFFQTPNTSAVMSNAPANRRGIASASLGTMRNFGMVTGEALSAALISFNMNKSAPKFIAQGLKGSLLWKAEFKYASVITCIAAAICVVIALILSAARGKIKPPNENINVPISIKTRL